MARRSRRPAAAGAAVSGPPAARSAIPQPTGRIEALDALRGLAIVAMVVYHFAFDLAHFGVIAADFYRDPLLRHTRTVILSSFLLIAGVSLVLAQRTERGRAGFWRHVAIIAACALAVSAGSYVAFPQSYIWFGVLHAVAASLVLVRPLAARPWLALALGIAVIVAGNTVASPAFDTKALGWVGFATARPRTEDYVPLFPWAGVMMIGIASGHALVRSGVGAVEPSRRAPAVLAWLGRHSLAVYMLHQPLLIGALLVALRR